MWRSKLRATPVLIPDTPDDLDSLDATIAHLQELGKPFMVDPIIEPIGSGFAASLGRYLEVRRRHPDVEMFMGIGNLTELTEADTTGVTAMLIGFCQELGIRNVLTTEVIDWARGAVREAVLAAQLMYFAQQEGTPPKHVDGRLLTIKDEEFRPYTEAELRELHASITDPNIRIFTDADWIYAFNAERFVKGTDINQIFDELGVDEHTHAFYLGKELMKASIARGLGKNYRQESPLDWGYLTFDEPRRERVRLTARSARRNREESPAPARHRGAPEPVRRDRRARRRRGRPAVAQRREGRVRARARAGRVLHPRAGRPQDDGRVGRRQERGRRRGDLRRGAEGVLRPLPRLGDDRLQRLQHDRGHDDRADREGAQPLRRPRGRDRPGSRRPAVGHAAPEGGLRGHDGRALARPVRRRSPPSHARAASRSRSGSASTSASRRDRAELEAILDGAQIVLSAGPAGVPVLRRDFWAQHPTIELLADYNAAEPLGIEGTKATDDMADYDGKLVLGALAIGGPKMKVHKTCVRRLFETNDQVLDTDAVYAIAKELV